MRFLSSREVLDYCNGSEIARVSCLNTTLKAFVAKCQVWNLVIRRDLPLFAVGEDLLNDPDYLPLAVACFGYLSHANLQWTCVIDAIKPRELKRLEACLRNAAQTTRSHIANGGRESHVLVGRFGMATGQTSRFRFGVDQYPLLQGFHAGEMELKICPYEGGIVLGAKYHEFGPVSSDPNAFNSIYTANIASVNSTTKLSYRGARLCMGGVLRKMQVGLCCDVRDHETQHFRLTKPLLCVVTLMDGSPHPATTGITDALAVEPLILGNSSSTED
eukprot:TRINITY_DN14124_c1_g2_i1.p1 TRINITY_DN14124_c1_g2~~TRINITY_DN14124_c1_g2_i1.p1  ORF type:complete len:274 (-),score=18.43 TRINITY_DN14124_c1_g2_i1:133-954(-)